MRGIPRYTLVWGARYLSKNTVIQNCIMNNLECAESVRGSNLKLLAEHKTRIHKMERVYQTPCSRASLLKGRIFLRRNGK